MPEDGDHVDRLTPREMDVLRLLAEDLSNREIAEKLVLSRGTVKWYNKQIYNKLVVNSRQEAVAVAREKGILERETAVSRAHNLPAAVTPFVGREQERRDLTALLTQGGSRLVTVMGAGGMGKTRLALEVGRQLADRTPGELFADGIYLVDLAPVDSPDNIVTAIGGALKFRFYVDRRAPEEQLLAYLRNKNLLLILDNFEHLLAGATTVTHLLQAAPQITLLVTSRERLNLGGETIFKLTGMDFPARPTAQDPLAYSAVHLFVQAAQRARPDFGLESEALPHVFRICRLVQGMPLALILAANWVEALSLAEIDEEMARSIDFLASQQRDLPRRLRSMRAVFDHSWKMMSGDESELFMKLCVFRGGFTREASEVVAGADLHGLITLSNKSLIQRDVDRGRYGIHELLRQYAAQQLQTSGQWEPVQRKHAAYYAQLAERAAPELRRANQEHWFQVLEDEHDNVRAALAWSFAGGDASAGLRIAAALRDFWFYNGYHVEGQRWYERALAHAEREDPILRGRIMLALGLLNWARQEMEACRRHWEGALSIFRAAGEDRLAAWALGLLGGSKWGDDSSDYRSDVARLETAIGTLRELGDKPGEAQMLNILGNVHRIPQNFQETRRAYEACLSVVRETGEKRRECMILSNLALVAYAEHDYEKAGSLARSGAEIADEMGFNMVLASCLHGLAGSVAATGRAREAARLLGAVAAYQESQGVTFAPNDQLYHDRISADVRRQLGAAGFQAAWEDGYRLPLGEAVEVALQL